MYTAEDAAMHDQRPSSYLVALHTRQARSAKNGVRANILTRDVPGHPRLARRTLGASVALFPLCGESHGSLLTLLARSTITAL